MTTRPFRSVLLRFAAVLAALPMTGLLLRAADGDNPMPKPAVPPVVKPADPHAIKPVDPHAKPADTPIHLALVDLKDYVTGPAAESVSAESVAGHIRKLASEELAGRGSGEPGLELAAEYIAGKFAEFGLEPGGSDGGWFQPFEVTVGSKLGAANKLEVSRAGGDAVLTRALTAGVEYEPFGGTAAAVEGPLAFVGYGITAKEYGRTWLGKRFKRIDYDDYAGLDVKGKVVLVWRYEPQEKDKTSVFDGDRNTVHAFFATKIDNARKHGAAGILFVTPGLHHEDTDPLDLGRSAGFGKGSVPAAFVRRAAVEPLFSAAGKDMLELQKQIDGDLKPRSFTFPGVKVALATEVLPVKKSVRNVLAKLPGNDAKLKDEYVVVGGHYDHLGMGRIPGSLAQNSKGKIHFGADDNASGTAGVLELARVFAEQKGQLRRGMLFQCYAGEELGLFGSKHWVNHPTVPLEKVAAMLNLDMIGRSKGTALQVIGTPTSPAFKALAAELAKGTGLDVSTPPMGPSFSGSDHQSFEGKGIPVLFYFTGSHADYHRPTDTADKINAETAAKVVRYVHKTAWQLDLQDERPKYTKPVVTAMHGTGGTPSGFRAYFGSMPDYEYMGKGVRLDGVAPNGPASKAGLKGGDILNRVGGVPMNSLQDFMDVLRTKKPGDIVEVELLRDKADLKIKVTLEGRAGG